MDTIALELVHLMCAGRVVDANFSSVWSWLPVIPLSVFLQTISVVVARIVEENQASAAVPERKVVAILLAGLWI